MTVERQRGEEKRGTVAWHTASGHCVAASSDPLFV